MIIFKDTKGFQSRSDKPNENWLEGEDVFVVDDNSDLARRISNAYPYYDFVVKNDKLVDIIELEKPPMSPEPPTAEERLQSLEEAFIALTLGGM